MTMQGPEFDGVIAEAADVAVEMLFVPVFQDDAGDAVERIPGLAAAAGAWISDARKSGEFRGKLYEFFIIPSSGGWKARRIALSSPG